jgi:hypothetical protein
VTDLRLWISDNYDLSAVFRAMLDSSLSSDIDVAIPVDESSGDFEIILLIIHGRAPEVLPRVATWKQAEDLYAISVKYQLDGHRPWFSRICRDNAPQEPWEAIFLACNQSPVDTDLIEVAIADGFDFWSPRIICNLLYF